MRRIKDLLARHSRLVISMALLVLTALALSMTGISHATERILCPTTGDAPDLNGPKDAFGRPTLCISGKGIMYTPDDPKPAPAPSLQGGGPSDQLRIETNLFEQPRRIDGRPSWSWIGAVAALPNGDIAYIVSNDWVWGSNMVKVVRPTMTNGVLSFTPVFEGAIDGRHISDLVAGDINGDGKTELVVIPSDDSQGNVIGQRGLVNVFWGETADNSAFTRVSFEAHNTPDSAALAPISGGRSTLGVMNWNSNVFQSFSPVGNTRAFTQTNFGFAVDQAGWDNTIIGDINDDKNPDFISLIGQYYLNPYFRTFKGNGQGVFVEGQSVYPPTRDDYENPSVAISYDSTGDRKDDIQLLSHGNFNPTSWGARLKIFKQIAPDASGNTISTTPEVLIADDIPSSVNVGKINCEDEIPDLSVVSAGWHRSMYFQGKAGGGYETLMRLEPHTVYVNGARPHIAQLMDLNGDGWKDEVFSADYEGLQVRLHRPCVIVTKTAPSTVSAGDSISYTIGVTNTGLLPVTNLMISDNVPASLTNLSSNDGTFNDHQFISTVFSLNPGQSMFVTINATTTTRGTIVNTAVACAKGACSAPATATTNVVQASVAPYKVSFTATDYNAPLSSNMVTATVQLDRVPTQAVQVPVYVFAGTTDLNTNPLGNTTVIFNPGQRTAQVVVNVGADKSPLVTIRVGILTNQTVVTYGDPWKALVHRAAVEGMQRSVYLPLVAREVVQTQPLNPIKINDAIPQTSIVGYPWVDAATKTFIHKTVTLVVPQNGIVYFTSTPTGLSDLQYDDAVRIMANGVQIDQFECTTGCGYRTLRMTPGATVTLDFYAYDVHEAYVGALEGWIHP